MSVFLKAHYFFYTIALFLNTLIRRYLNRSFGRVNQ